MAVSMELLRKFKKRTTEFKFDTKKTVPVLIETPKNKGKYVQEVAEEALEKIKSEQEK